MRSQGCNRGIQKPISIADFVQDGCRQMRALALRLAGFGWCWYVLVVPSDVSESVEIFLHSFSTPLDLRKRRGAPPKDKILSVKRLPATQRTHHADPCCGEWAARSFHQIWGLQGVGVRHPPLWNGKRICHGQGHRCLSCFNIHGYSTEPKKLCRRTRQLRRLSKRWTKCRSRGGDRGCDVLRFKEF